MRSTAVRSRLLAAGAITAMSVAVTACGGSGSSSGKSANASANANKPTVEWVVHVTGNAETPPGPSSAVGYAIIALHDPLHEVCWRFAHLHGFHNATSADISKGGPHTTGALVMTLTPGPALHHQGCVTASKTLLTALAADPTGFYVNIHSVANPKGAVRAQL
ncbi:MAG: CHRD domain-containing protein [Solirubrobacteraceae bacterium]